MVAQSSDGGLTLAATGDSIITRSVLPLLGRSPGFSAVVERLREADATVTNLEVVVTDRGSYATVPRAIGSQYQYLSSFPAMIMRADPGVLDELVDIGVNLFSTANNHSYDFGRHGMIRTMAELDARGISYAGLGQTLHGARAPSYRTTTAGRVGLVHATTSVPPGGEASPTSSSVSGRPGINPLHVHWTYNIPKDHLGNLKDIAEIVGINDVKESWLKREGGRNTHDDAFSFMHMAFKPVDDTDAAGIELTVDPIDRNAFIEQIREADSQADWVVATLHSHQGPGGSRNCDRTPPFLETIAKDCIDAGADSFICTGPHVLRGIELYRGKPIFYSVGNFFCQIETQDRIPTEAYEFYGIDDENRPSKLMDRRYLSDGDPRGNLAYPEYWETVVPTCSFTATGELEGIELIPCELGRERSRPQRGTPKRVHGSEAAKILESITALSEPYGTTITLDGDLGIVEPPA